MDIIFEDYTNNDHIHEYLYEDKESRRSSTRLHYSFLWYFFKISLKSFL